MGISAKGGRGDEIRSFLRFPLAPAEGRRKSGREGIGNCEEDHDGRMGEAGSKLRLLRMIKIQQSFLRIVRFDNEFLQIPAAKNQSKKPTSRKCLVNFIPPVVRTRGGKFA